VLWGRRIALKIGFEAVTEITRGDPSPVGEKRIMHRFLFALVLAVVAGWSTAFAQTASVRTSTYPVVGFVPDIDVSFSCVTGSSCDVHCFDSREIFTQVTGWNQLEVKSIGAGFVLMTGYKDAAKSTQVNGGPIMIRDVLYCEITEPASLN